jgi:hypothetical protein
MNQTTTQSEEPIPLGERWQQQKPARKSSASLEQLLNERASGLRAILADLESQTRTRKELSEGLIASIEDDYLYTKNLLLPLEEWPISADRSLDPRRRQLEDRLQHLRSEAHREMIDRWRDTAQLKREFREWFKSYHDQTGRMRLINAMGTPRPR